MVGLNMCMFTSQVDYDAAVRKHYEEVENVANKQQTAMSFAERLTEINNMSIMLNSLNKESHD